MIVRWLLIAVVLLAAETSVAKPDIIGCVVEKLGLNRCREQGHHDDTNHVIHDGPTIARIAIHTVQIGSLVHR